GGAGSAELADRARGLVEARLAETSAAMPRALLLLLLASLVGSASLTSVGAARAGEAESPGDADARARLERAIADYEAAQAETDREARLAAFARAERGFASLIEDGTASAALYTNLGHAALQAGRRGEAVLAYRRALLLDPGATTPRQNLAHLRAQLPAWVPRPSSS